MGISGRHRQTSEATAAQTVCCKHLLQLPWLVLCFVCFER